MLLFLLSFYNYLCGAGAAHGLPQTSHKPKRVKKEVADFKISFIGPA